MKFIRLQSTDPYYNLAVEEYLFSHTEDDVFMLWQNDPVVVIGRNQNAYAELNPEVARARGIRVARRITGGGAVYHDMGNLNYTYISARDGKGEIDFATFSAPVIDLLASLGVCAELSGRNDLLVDGKKFSGNAQHASGDRVLHHGTLLFDSDLEALSSALHVDEEKLRARAIRSVRSRVTNLRPYLPAHCDAQGFMAHVADYVARTYGAQTMDVPACEEIERLYARNASEKWIFPERALVARYELVKKKRYPFGTVEMYLDMERETVRDIRICGDFFGVRPIAELEERLRGASIGALSARLSGLDVGAYIFGMNAQELIELLCR